MGLRKRSAPAERSDETPAARRRPGPIGAVRRGYTWLTEPDEVTAQRLRGDSRKPAAAPARAASPREAAPVQPQRAPLAGTYVGNGRVLVYLDGGGRLYVSADDVTLVPELLATGVYDPGFTRFLRRTLTPDDVFVDVGANVGLFTIVASHQAWRGRVIAYEPAPALADLLRVNVLANWLTDRITVRPVAVGSSAGRASFSFPRSMHLLGGLDVDPAVFEDLLPGHAVDRLDVDVVALDDDLADVGEIALVKIDVEGGEADVLGGMHGLLDRGVVRALTLEFRRDNQDRRSGSSWDALVAQVSGLCARGGRLARLDDGGAEHPVTLDEAIGVGLYANLLVRFDA